MTERRPLVRIDGETVQLPPGDKLPADALPSSAGGGASGVFDGGGATAHALGTPAIDFGGAT